MARFGTLLALFMVLAALPAAAQSRAALCQFLPVKGGMAGADYVPGIDVSGKPVVPADLNSVPAGSFVDVVRFPVTIDLAQQLNQPLPQGTEMQAPVAMIEIHNDSRVLYNGQDLTNEVYTLCEKGVNEIEAAASETGTVVPPIKPAPIPLMEALENAPSAAQKSEQEEILWGEGY